MAYSFAIRPVGHLTFADEDEQIRKCKEWGLLTDKASRMKTFYYKGNGLNMACTVVGYVDDVTAVISFDDGTLHCIHPSYLKEMQASQFGTKPAAPSDEPAEAADEPKETAGGPEGDAATEASPNRKDGEAATDQTDDEAAAKRTAPKSSRSGTGKIKLPEDKVRMRAVVEQFTTVPNHFADEDDEVVVYGDVVIEELGVELGSAWSSHSATLKKMELQVGDALTFEAKVAAKKLTRHPVPYKINNPSKIQKL
ncbi:hypothetical protein FE782_01885 [Paenibacillus antri]|uniref:Uncharacterized protein n=1 Tax=Paenibacillus antri TaxID=2582848 RepID=A0A5R9GII7_9BACL|nr:hypothetical protein [Paenibacillus antri]TLS54120.1 hypothetical protein FE782_01885 [Paenibacillus antri]